MATIAFWSNQLRECGQTLSMAALAAFMATEHNYKILVIDATFNTRALEACFFPPVKQNSVVAELNRGKLDIASGAEGLISAIVSNKTSPEIIKNYTRLVFKGSRLDVLPALETKIFDDYEKQLQNYKEILSIANKYYDFVFIDLDKGLRSPNTIELLKAANIIVVNMTQGAKLVKDYINLKAKNPLFKGENVIPLVGRYDVNSKQNSKNIARELGEKEEISAVPYNTLLFDASLDNAVANYFLKVKLASDNDRNVMFVEHFRDIDQKIIYKLQEMQMKMKM